MRAKRVVATDVILLKHHLTALHLPTFKAECEQTARQCATDNAVRLGFCTGCRTYDFSGRISLTSS